MRLTNNEEIREMTLAAKDDIWELAQSLGREPKIYLHWSAGHYDQPNEHYTFNIFKDGSVYVSVEDLSDVGQHTFKRNSGSIGLTMTCCAFATSNGLGDEPPTEEQIGTMAQITAIIAQALEIPIDLNHVMTHGEAGDNLDGLAPHDPYGPDSTCERWDLAILKDGDEWQSGGDTMRGNANWFLAELIKQQ